MQLVDNERTRLYVEGVRNAITANVTRRRHDGMTVTQALPFLRLDTPVTESGRRTRIRRVEIAMEGDVPKLLVELMHDHEAPEAAEVMAESEPAPYVDEDTVETFTPGVSTMPARTDSTVPYEFQQRADRSDEIVLTDPIHEPPALATVMQLRPPVPQPWYVRFVRRVFAALASLTSMPASDASV